MTASRPEERRGGRRVTGAFGVGLDETQFGSLLRVRDLSTSGVSFHMAKPVEEMTRVKLVLWLPAGAEPRTQAEFPCSGVVVRSEPGAATGPGDLTDYEVAVFFTDLPQPTIAAVEGYIAAQQRSAPPTP